jgi:hypothetical protein
MKRAMAAMPVMALVAAGGVALAGPASAAPAHLQALACGAVVTQNVTLANDVGPCAGDGITIQASNVTLNLNGHRVFGALNTFGTGPVTGTDAVGIEFNNVNRSKVTNGEVFNFAAGVRIDNGGANTVKDMNSHDNISPIGDSNNGDGISVWNSSFNTIENNTVTHNGQYSGISLLTGPYNNLTPTTVNPAESGTGNDILNNVVTGNNVQLCSNRSKTGQPLPCSPAAGGTFAYGAQIPGSLDEGIDVNGPNMSNSVVQGNTVINAGNNGIMVNPSCHDAFLVPAAATTCAGDGGNVNTVIKDNVSNDNGFGRTNGFGINLFGMGISKAVEGSYDTVTGNTTEYNRDGGIILYSSSCQDQPTNSPVQCAAVHDNILNNTSSYNGLSLGVNTSQGDGIEMSAGTDYNTVSRNLLVGNDSDGIGVEMAENSAGTAYIPGSGSSHNTLSHNQARQNHYFDAEDQNPGCDSNNWTHNIFVTVSQSCVAS